MTSRNDATPAANGGHIANPQRQSYRPTRQSATGRIGARLSPRRKLYAQLVLTLLCRDRVRWRDGEVRLVPATYAFIEDELELDRFATNQAIDDLFALGLIDVRLSGTTQIVTPLASDIEEAA
jgi:hypothetical protein